ncbi:MAG: RNA methyltransferase, partial [Lachnospiraceae bacterium]|nr:RNA methyltransferase [Lachnospiraceae bacterium]
MLIERDRAVKAGTMYGLDLFGEAIDKARRNAKRASALINYINRDFFTFKHSYLFDEVITDMPHTAGDGSKRALRQFYHDFFGTVGALLKEEAALILYTSEPNYVVESVRSCPNYQIEKSFLLNEKNGTTVFVISWNRN